MHFPVDEGGRDLCETAASVKAFAAPPPHVTGAITRSLTCVNASSSIPGTRSMPLSFQDGDPPGWHYAIASPLYPRAAALSLSSSGARPDVRAETRSRTAGQRAIFMVNASMS